MCMLLTELVSKHGFSPSQLGEISNAKLYERTNQDGATELLCVQKIGNVFRIDRQAVMIIPGMGVLPLGEGLSNFIVPREQLETFLDSTLAPVPVQ